jgi:hypothetical protein
VQVEEEDRYMKHFLSVILLFSIMLVGCDRSSPVNQATSPVTMPVQSTNTASPTSVQLEVTAASTTESVAAGPYALAISDSYPFFPPAKGTTKLIIGESLAASPGKVWIGSGYGTIEEVDSQSGAFIGSIPVTGDIEGTRKNIAGIEMTMFPILKLAVEGQYLWLYGMTAENIIPHGYLLAVDPENGSVARQFDLDSAAWMKGYERRSLPDDLGISPGKVWIDNHIVNTQTFEVTADIGMPGMTLFAYNGKDWMWMTGDTGYGDGLVFVNTDDPSQYRHQFRWPFLVRPSGVGPANPLVLAGDRIWIGSGISGDNPTYSLEAYTADVDQLMNDTGPLASVPLLGSYQKIRMLYAENYLWVIYTHGEKGGLLCQLDPKTGETINSLDLVGDQGRSISDVPQDIATEGDNLWVLTTRQLLRIKLP